MALSDQLQRMLALALQLARAEKTSGLLLLVESPIDLGAVKSLMGEVRVVVATEQQPLFNSATDAKLPAVLLDTPGAPVYEKLTQALLESVADDLLEPGARVVALYSGFEIGLIDSISLIHLGEHLGRLTVRDLRQLETRVPLDTLRMVVDLAVDIGREGREGKPVGALFVVGDHRATRKHCHPVGFDPVRGYNKKERNLGDARVREGIKEIVQMDGAIVIAADGTVEAAAQFISAPAVNITLSKGLGARHWAAAAISRATNAVAVAVSETSGTVRVFQNGEVVLRIEPFRRAMKWRDFEYDPRAGGDQQRGK